MGARQVRDKLTLLPMSRQGWEHWASFWSFAEGPVRHRGD